MPQSAKQTKLIDMVLCFSRALDLLHEQISDHHLLVANIGVQIAEAAGFDEAGRSDVLIGGALHDVGVVSVDSRLALSDFSLTTYRNGSDQPPHSIHHHGYEGWRLLQGFAPFARAAEGIRYHHVNWQGGIGTHFYGRPVPLASHVIHLADRIAVLPSPDTPILAQRERIVSTIRAAAGSIFHPDLVEAFADLSCRDAFWFDLVYPHQESLLRTRARGMRHPLDIDQLHELSVVFGRIIDFRSPFTATHSTGVATSAASIAGLMGIGSDELKLITIAGHLHDLGKLAVPPSILDKPGPLAPDEASIMRSHAYHTYRILEMVPGMETINAWAAFHHERVGGGGYPFMPAALPLQARIIAVADVFTALSEDRPYRFGMSRPEVVAILRREVAQGALDGDVVATVLDNFDVLDQQRHLAQHAPSRHGAVADPCWQDEAWSRDRFSRKEGVA